MITKTTSTQPSALGKEDRIQSVDIFRSLTMLIMIFVNDIASVKGLPSWTYHIGPGINSFTYVDMVFPTFLFIVGLSIPLAIKSRKSKGDSALTIFKHVIIRTLSLLFVGVLIINGRAMDAEATGMSYGLWNTLMLVGVILFWNVYPRTDDPIKTKVYAAFKWGGAALLAVLLVMFRRIEGDEAIWLRTEWWGILGLIGWAYLVASAYTLMSKQGLWRLITVFIGLIMISCLKKMEYITIPSLIDPLVNCVLAPVVIAGVVVSTIVITNTTDTPWVKVRNGATWAVVVFIFAFLLKSLGINGGNPSWSLFSSAIATTLFLGFYILVDIYKVSKWALFLAPLGVNTLLAYLLPDIFYALFEVKYIKVEMFNEGMLGVARTVIFTALMATWTWAMTKMSVRLKL